MTGVQGMRKCQGVGVRLELQCDGRAGYEEVARGGCLLGTSV
jgi:hypothetical protein